MSQHRLGRCPCCEHGGIKDVVELLRENNITVEVSHNDLILTANLPSRQPSGGEYSTAKELLPPQALGEVIPKPNLRWSNFVHKDAVYILYYFFNKFTKFLIFVEIILFCIGVFTGWEWYGYDYLPITGIVIVVLPLFIFVLRSYSDKGLKQIERDNQKQIEAGRKRKKEEYNRDVARRQEQIARYQRLVYCYTCHKFFDTVVIKGQKRCWKPKEMARFLRC